MLLVVVAWSPARSQEAGHAEAAGSASDPVLERLVAESLAARPELKQAQDLLRAQRERIPQAGALPDPVLSLGIQNDGFDSLQIGKMDTSFYQVMVSQGLPWPGKRDLRTELASLESRQAEAGLDRIRLSTCADVRRTYLDLILVRERLLLLDLLDAIWQQSIGIARARYEAGEGAQSDVLRAQLELNRIRQRRWALQAEEQTRVQSLNRLRARPVEVPIPTIAKVRDRGTPHLGDPETELDDAERRSPELTLARLAALRAERQTDLARRERFPDFSVNAGVMPRGELEPMWQAGLSLNLPLWSYRKQIPAVTESEARASGEARGVEAIAQILRLRVAERRAALAALLEMLRLYRDGLLVQSQATAESTLAQYRVGRVTFASVLEANAGYINDEEGYLLAAAEADRIAIARDEVSLEPVGASLGGGAMGSASVPGAGSARAGVTGATGGGASSGSPPAAGGGSSPSMSKM